MNFCGKKYAFIEKDRENLCSDRKFVRMHIDTIEHILKNPANSILFTDRFPSGEYIIRYLYQNPHIINSPNNIVIYHKKKEPEWNPLHFSTKSIKTTDLIISQLKMDSDEIIFL